VWRLAGFFRTPSILPLVGLVGKLDDVDMHPELATRLAQLRQSELVGLARLRNHSDPASHARARQPRRLLTMLRHPTSTPRPKSSPTLVCIRRS
jgi:hypothetical protein